MFAFNYRFCRKSACLQTPVSGYSPLPCRDLVFLTTKSLHYGDSQIYFFLFFLYHRPACSVGLCVASAIVRMC